MAACQTPPQKCANCSLFGYPQPDCTTLQRCGKCKVLQYCGKDCQGEHWVLVHKKHCKMLAVAVELEKKAKDSPGIPVSLYSHHPFGGAAQSGDTTEALVILVQKILCKMWATNHPACPLFPVELMELAEKMQGVRMDIWSHRKIAPPEDTAFFPEVGANQFFFSKLKIVPDRDGLDLWSTLHMLYGRILDYHVILCANSFKDVANAIPKKEEWSHINMEDIGIFSTGSEKLIDALSSQHQQFLPFKELLKIFLGNSLDHRCSFCDATLTVVALMGEVIGASSRGRPLALLKPFAPPGFTCGQDNCTLQLHEKGKAWDLWSIAVMTTYDKLRSTRCDGCFKLVPQVHR